MACFNVREVTHCAICGQTLIRLEVNGRVFSEGESVGDLCGSPACELAYWANVGGYLERDVLEVEREVCEEQQYAEGAL